MFLFSILAVSIISFFVVARNVFLCKFGIRKIDSTISPITSKRVFLDGQNKSNTFEQVHNLRRKTHSVRFFNKQAVLVKKSEILDAAKKLSEKE